MEKTFHFEVRNHRLHITYTVETKNGKDVWKKVHDSEKLCDCGKEEVKRHDQKVWQVQKG